MRIVSGSSLLLASLALSGSSYAAPVGMTSTDPVLPTSSTPGSRARVFSDSNKARLFAGLAGGDDKRRTVPVMGNILKPVEHIPCGVGNSMPHHVSPGLQVDCEDLNNRILGGSGISEGQPESTRLRPESPRALPTPTKIIDVDPSTYPPTEPSSFYEIDPTPRPAFTNPPEIPVISAIKPTVPGGPTITAIIGHLSIVLDHPPPTSTADPTSTAVDGDY